MGFELNYCQVCGIQLAPDDFDGICSECDNDDAPTPKFKVEANGWTCSCGWWNVDANACRKCGASLHDLVESGGRASGGRKDE
jgi:hypothetical protein